MPVRSPLGVSVRGMRLKRETRYPQEADEADGMVDGWRFQTRESGG